MRNSKTQLATPTELDFVEQILGRGVIYLVFIYLLSGGRLGLAWGASLNSAILFGLTTVLAIVLSFSIRQKQGVLTNVTELFRQHLSTLLLFSLFCSLTLLSLIGVEPEAKWLRPVVDLGITAVLVLATIWFRPKLSDLKKVTILILLVQCSVAIMQYHFQHDLGLQILGEPVLAATRGHPILFVNGEFVLRATGLLEAPNWLATLIFTSSFLLLLPEPIRMRQAFQLLFFSLFVLAGFLTFSRSALLGFALGLVVLNAANWYQKESDSEFRQLAVAASLLVLLVLGAAFVSNIDIVIARTSPAGNEFEDRSVNTRLNQYELAYRLIKEAPLLGVGVGDSRRVAKEVLSEYDYALFGDSIHNIPLRFATELGVLGGVLWVSVLVIPMRSVRKGASSHERILMSALACFIVIDMFLTFSGSRIGFLYHWFLVAMWSVEYRKTKSKIDAVA